MPITVSRRCAINVLKQVLTGCPYCMTHQRLIRYKNGWWQHIWPNKDTFIGCFEQTAQEILREYGIKSVDALN